MASSLDDMEAYELLQIELDRALKSYVHSIGENTPQTLHFLNSWIEYICFHRHLSVWSDIVSEETEEDFFGWYRELIKDSSFSKEGFQNLLKTFQAQYPQA